MGAQNRQQLGGYSGYSHQGYGYAPAPGYQNTQGQDTAKSTPANPPADTAKLGDGDQIKARSGAGQKPVDQTVPGSGQQQQQKQPPPAVDNAGLGPGGDDVIDGEQLPLPPSQDRGFDDWYESAPASPNLGGWPTTPKEPVEPEVPTASKDAHSSPIGERKTPPNVHIVFCAFLELHAAGSGQAFRACVWLKGLLLQLPQPAATTCSVNLLYPGLM
jgi:hypothetical protein